MHAHSLTQPCPQLVKKFSTGSNKDHATRGIRATEKRLAARDRASDSDSTDTADSQSKIFSEFSAEGTPRKTAELSLFDSPSDASARTWSPPKVDFSQMI